MIKIRQAIETDEDAVFSLALQFPAPAKLDKSIFSLTIKDKIRDPDCYLGVVLNDDDVIAYASGSLHSTFYANGPTFWLDEILVDEDFRLASTGRQLIDDVSRWSSERGCKLISLATNGASEFYNSIGFEDSARYFKKYL